MASPVDNIKHVVVLMMENRSFDHMFGMMMDPDWPVDGLTGLESNPDSAENNILVNADADYSGQLTPDPGHHFPDVNMQIFGNYEGINTGALMMGFVTSYETHTHDRAKAARIMNCFDPKKIPVLTTLAKSYAVCDRWFSSVPGPTLPNRSFMHAATSIGRTDMSPVWFDESKTIYELLEENGHSAKIFYHDSTVAMTFKMLQSGQSKWFGTIDDFYRACKHNTLPAYSFLEPRYFDSDDGVAVFEASDQHPDHNVIEGENLIRNVYEAVQQNPDVWKSTLLVIVYDEHGGLYDHVTPPAAVNPDGKAASDPGEDVAKIPPFSFDRLGIRVPAVIISAYIDPRVDSTEYDHTSALATARKILLGDGWEQKFLTERDRNANTFEHLLTRDTPRDGKLDFKPLLDAMPIAPVSDVQGRLDGPLSDHQKVLVQHALDLDASLPEGLKSGKTAADVTTVRQASLFIRQVGENVRAAQVRKAGGGD